MLWDPVGKRLLPMRNQKNGIRLLNTGCISMKNRTVRKLKPKLASNLALGNEMKTNLDEAYEWANKSYELFKKSEGEDGKNTKLLALYIEVLRNRIRSDKKLNMQFGE